MNTELKTAIDEARELGFKTAASSAEMQYVLAKKMLRAYSGYTVITDKQFNTFCEQLKKSTLKQIDRYTQTWKKVVLCKIEEYASVPPVEVLNLFKAAKAEGLFDSYRVAYIADHEERRDPDPILFARITNCPDYFVIAQWGDDIKVADIVSTEVSA